MNVIKGDKMKTRNVYFIRFYDGELCMLGGSGLTPNEAVNDIKKRLIKEAISTSIRDSYKEKSLYDIEKDVVNWIAGADSYYNNFRLITDVYTEQFDEERQDWIGVKASKWSLKYPLKLSVIY